MNPFKKSSQYQNKLLNRFNPSYSSKVQTGHSFRTFTSSTEKDDTNNKYRNHISFLQLKLENNKKVIEALEEQIRNHVNAQKKMNSNINYLQRQNSDLVKALYQAEEQIKQMRAQLRNEQLHYSIKSIEDKLKQRSPKKVSHFRTTTSNSLDNPQFFSPARKEKPQKIKTEEDTALTLCKNPQSLEIHSQITKFNFFSEKNIQALSEMVGLKDEKISKLESAIYFLNKKQQEKEKQSSARISQMEKAMSHRIEELEQEVKQKDESLVRLESEYGEELNKTLELMSDLQKKIELIEADKMELQRQYKKEIEDLSLKENSEGEAQASKIEELEKVIDEKIQKQEQICLKLKQLQEQYAADIEKNKAEWSQKLSTLQQQMKQTLFKLQQQSQISNSLKAELASQEESLKNKSNRIQQMQSKLKDVEKVRDQSRQKMIGAQSELGQVKKELGQLKEERISERKNNKEINKQLEEKEQILSLMTAQMHKIKQKFDVQKYDKQSQYQIDEEGESSGCEGALSIEELQGEFQRILGEKMSEIQLTNEGWEKDKAQLEEIQKEYNKICDQVAFHEEALEVARSKIEELNESLEKKDEQKQQNLEEIEKLRRLVGELEEKTIFYEEYMEKLKNSSVSN